MQDREDEREGREKPWLLYCEKLEPFSSGNPDDVELLESGEENVLNMRPSSAPAYPADASSAKNHPNNPNRWLPRSSREISTRRSG